MNILNLMFIGLLLVVGCGSPEEILEEHLKKLGYITYTTPLQFTGTGTLIGGRPSALSIVAPPASCFPYDDEENSFQLRYEDPTVLPQVIEEFDIGGKVKLDFLTKLLAAGMPSIRAGVGLRELKKVHVEFRKPRVEYFDGLRLTEYYRNNMSELCKDYLERVGFMIQALKVEEMSFIFYRKSSGKVDLTVEGIEEFIDVDFDVDWRIENRYSLIISTPKYIGYQLGRIRRKDDGFVFKRSTKTKKDRFVWKRERIFNRPKSLESSLLNAKYFDNSLQDIFFYSVDKSPRIR